MKVVLWADNLVLIFIALRSYRPAIWRKWVG